MCAMSIISNSTAILAWKAGYDDPTFDQEGEFIVRRGHRLDRRFSPVVKARTEDELSRILADEIIDRLASSCQPDHGKSAE